MKNLAYYKGAIIFLRIQARRSHSQETRDEYYRTIEDMQIMVNKIESVILIGEKK